jgi:hypothetical protein
MLEYELLQVCEGKVGQTVPLPATTRIVHNIGEKCKLHHLGRSWQVKLVQNSRAFEWLSSRYTGGAQLHIASAIAISINRVLRHGPQSVRSCSKICDWTTLVGKTLNCNVKSHRCREARTRANGQSRWEDSGRSLGTSAKIKHTGSLMERVLEIICPWISH